MCEAVSTHLCSGSLLEHRQERLCQILLADVRVEAVAVVRERARATFIQLRPTPSSWIGILHVNLQVVTATTYEGPRTTILSAKLQLCKSSEAGRLGGSRSVVFDSHRSLQVGRTTVGAVIAFLKALGKREGVLSVHKRAFSRRLFYAAPTRITGEILRTRSSGVAIRAHPSNPHHRRYQQEFTPPQVCCSDQDSPRSGCSS